MRMLQIRKLLPLRNEKFEVYKWDEEDIALNPGLVQSVRTEVDKTMVTLSNGNQLFVEGDVDDFCEMFEDATENKFHVAELKVQQQPSWREVFIAGGVASILASGIIAFIKRFFL